MKNLAVIIAHPDDEAFGPSGTIAILAKKYQIHILCVTKGDADAKFSSYKGDLAFKRAHELKSSAKILGVNHVKFLGYKDGSLCNNLYHQLADAMIDYLKRWKPEIIITFEPRGISGHLDHVAVSLITTYVFEKLPFIRKLMYYCISEKWRKMIKDYFIYFPPGYEEKEVNKIIDISRVWSKKVAAIKTHVTQIKDGERILKGLSQLPKVEYFIVRSKSLTK